KLITHHVLVCDFGLLLQAFLIAIAVLFRVRDSTAARIIRIIKTPGFCFIYPLLKVALFMAVHVYFVDSILVIHCVLFGRVSELMHVSMLFLFSLAIQTNAGSFRVPIVIQMLVWCPLPLVS